jgi:phosphinothricin acetyltransferase
MDFVIDTMRHADWGPVKAIYRAGLASGLAAFMTDPPGWRAWDAGHLPLGRLVVRAAGDKGSDMVDNTGGGPLLGFSALAPVPDT